MIEIKDSSGMVLSSGDYANMFENVLNLTVKELIDDMMAQGYEYQTIRDYRDWGRLNGKNQDNDGTPFMIIAATGDSALRLNSTMLRITSTMGGD